MSVLNVNPAARAALAIINARDEQRGNPDEVALVSVMCKSLPGIEPHTVRELAAFDGAQISKFMKSMPDMSGLPPMASMGNPTQHIPENSDNPQEDATVADSHHRRLLKTKAAQACDGLMMKGVATAGQACNIRNSIHQMIDAGHPTHAVEELIKNCGELTKNQF